MKNKKIISLAIKLKKHTLVLVCAAVLIITASITGGAIELIARACEMLFASSAQQSLPLGEYYELQAAPPFTVAIDAGHGNMDYGAKGHIKEIVVTEKTADALYELLSADTNYSPVLTRQKGEEIKSDERARRAINAKASLFISLHANVDHSSGNTNGFECYPTPPGRKYSDESMKLAQRLTANMALTGNRLRGETGIKFAYYYGKSKKIVDGTSTKVRSQKSFGVVEKPLCPSVLVEQCFITSHKDIAAWGSDEGCKKAARVYYTAICEYFGTQPIAA